MLLNFLWIFQNCGPHEDNYPTYHIDQATLDYCFYDEGSWWVYEEEGSGERDTILNVSTSRSMTKNDNLGSIRELYSMKNNSKLFGDFTLAGGPARNMPKLNISEESFVIPPHSFGDLLFVSNLDTSFTYVLSNVEQIKIKDTIASLKIKDSIYSDVRIFENLSGSYASHQKTIYWARHIGKIRVERADGTVWNLIAYQVSQNNL